MTASTHTGCIVSNAARVYYVPSQRALPPLRWVPTQQKFSYLDITNAEDFALRATLEGLTCDLAESSTYRRAAATSYARSSSKATAVLESINDVVGCAALYGVLPLGPSVSVLLYVTELEKITTLTVGSASHDVYVVRRLEWMRLPSMPSQRDAENKNGSDLMLSDTQSTGTPENPASASAFNIGSEEEDDGAAAEGITEAIISEYLHVIDRYCVECSTDKSQLHYSPTINLALSPEEMLARTGLPSKSASSASSPLSLLATAPNNGSINNSRHVHIHCSAVMSSQAVFQWNSMLQTAFEVPTCDILKREGSSNRRRMGADSPLPGHLKDSTTGGMLGDVGDDVLSLYMPSFMRGVVRCEKISNTVSLHLVTRLSCRWAGTRYNRRGLEPGGSGVCANFAITSVWLTNNKDTHSRQPQQRAAVLTLLRGSVPRRWDQPANLSFKPPIKISAPHAAAEELCSHLRLLDVLLPHAEQLFCLDTTSTSSLEKPLSESFTVSVDRTLEQQQLGNSNGNGSGGAVPLAYLKFDMKVALKGHNYRSLREALVAEVTRKGTETLGPADKDKAAAGRPDSWLSFTRVETPSEPLAEYSSGAPRLVEAQSKYYRVNCLDCLDRTNLAQALLSDAAMESMLSYVLHDDQAAAAALLPQTLTALRSLYAEQGIALSQLYANTEPHFLHFLLGGEQGRYAPSLHEGTVALRRWFHQNFSDGRKQDAVSLLTRQHDPRMFDSDIESPFSRDFSSMNRQVLLGVLFALVPLTLSLCFLLTASSLPEQQLYSVIFAAWLVYAAVLFTKVRRYPQTYTNRPLLSYSM